jgi:hypothetical protein
MGYHREGHQVEGWHGEGRGGKDREQTLLR